MKDHSGNVWRRKPTDMYVIEITTDKTFEALTGEHALMNYNQVSVYRHLRAMILPGSRKNVSAANF